MPFAGRRRPPLLAAAALAMVSACGFPSPGGRVERALPENAVHRYRVRAAAGQFVHLVVDQGERDLAVEVDGRSGARLLLFDGADFGMESVSFVAEADGSYRISVRHAGRKQGRPIRYSVELKRAGTDIERINTEHAATEAKLSRAAGGLESLAQARKQIEVAAAVWRSAGGAFGEACALLRSGELSYAQGEFSLDKGASFKAWTRPAHCITGLQRTTATTMQSRNLPRRAAPGCAAS